jgi:hypothetical protein
VRLDTRFGRFAGQPANSPRGRDMFAQKMEHLPDDWPLFRHDG